MFSKSIIATEQDSDDSTSINVVMHYLIARLAKLNILFVLRRIFHCKIFFFAITNICFAVNSKFSENVSTEWIMSSPNSIQSKSQYGLSLSENYFNIYQFIADQQPVSVQAKINAPCVGLYDSLLGDHGIYHVSLVPKKFSA